MNRNIVISILLLVAFCLTSTVNVMAKSERKKKKTEKRVIWVRVMAILLALLLAGSVLGVIFTTTAV